MSKFVDCAQNHAFLLLPDLRNWIPEDDLAHFNCEFGLVSIKAETNMNNCYVWNTNSGARFFTCSIPKASDKSIAGSAPTSFTLILPVSDRRLNNTTQVNNKGVVVDNACTL